jgi:hypothetical protein
VTRLLWVCVGIIRRAQRRVHIKLHRLFCYFGVHRPVGPIVSLPTGEYLIEKTIYAGDYPVPVAGHPGLERQGRRYIPTGADPTGQRDATEAFQVALSAACKDKRLWCEFCERLLEPPS